DRRGDTYDRGSRPGGCAVARCGSGRGGQAGVRRPGPHVDARGHVSRGRGGRGLVSVVLTIMGYVFREAVRRKVFAVVVLLTAAFLVLFWLATHYVFTRLSTIQPPAGVHVDTRTFAGAFMLFGAALTAGLLGTIGHALSSPTIEHASKVAAWALPFEALYQDGLRLISSNASGLTGFLLQLGPFGGAYVHGWGIRVWAASYLCVALALALFLFRRRDL